MATATLTLRLLKNCLFDLHCGKLLFPRHSRRPTVDPSGLYSTILTEHFHLDEDHIIELPDIDPHIPKKREGMPQAYHDALTAAAFADATKRRADAAEMVRRIRHYCDRGVLKVVADPTGFLDDMDDLAPSNVELEVAEAAAIAPAKKAK